MVILFVFLQEYLSVVLLCRNYLQFLNGTEIACRGEPTVPVDIGNEIIVGVKGILSDEEYKSQTSSPRAGVPVPRQGYALNNEEFPFPYWSSPALTDALLMQVLVKYSSVCYDRVELESQRQVNDDEKSIATELNNLKRVYTPSPLKPKSSLAALLLKS